MIGPRAPKTLGEIANVLKIVGELGGGRDSAGYELSLSSSSLLPRIHQNQDSADDGGAHGVSLGDQHASSTSLTLEETVPCQSVPSHQACWFAKHFEAALPDAQFAPVVRYCTAAVAKSGGECLEEAHARELLVEAAHAPLMTSVKAREPLSLVDYLAYFTMSKLDRRTWAAEKGNSHLLSLSRNLVTTQLMRVVSRRDPETDNFTYDPLRARAVPLDRFVVRYLPGQLSDLLIGRHGGRAAKKHGGPTAEKSTDQKPSLITWKSDEDLSLADARRAHEEWIEEEARNRGALDGSDDPRHEGLGDRADHDLHGNIALAMQAYDEERERAGDQQGFEREANDVDLERPELLSGLAMRILAFESEFTAVLRDLDTSTLPKRVRRNATNIINALHLVARRDPSAMKASAIEKRGGNDEEGSQILSLSWVLASRVPELHQQNVAMLIQRANGKQACEVICRFVEYLLSQSPELARLADQIWRLRRDWCDLFAKRLSLEFARLPERVAESRNYRDLRDRLEQRLGAHRKLFLIVAPPTSA